MNDARRFDHVIVGAGPAGLQLAYFLQRAGRDYVVLDRADRAGSFFATHPRHRRLLSINKVYTGRDDPEFNLRHDWNSLLSDDPTLRMPAHSRDYFPHADSLVEYLERFAAATELRIHFGRSVASIGRDPETLEFRLTCESGDVYTSPRVIMATGLCKPNIPEIPGIELATGYEVMSLDLEDFANKNVLVLGKGNSAFETAKHLIPAAAVLHLISPTPVKLAWDTRYVGHLRAVNNELLDTYHLKSQNAVIDGIISEMRRLPSGKIRVRFSSIHAADEVEQLEYDHVLRCTGFRFDADVFEASCRPAMSPCGRLPRMTPGFEAVGVPDLFFAGSTTQALDYKQAQSAFIHGFRYNARTLFHLLQARYHAVPLPFEALDPTPRGLATGVLGRMNRASSLWQQVGFLADLVVLPAAGEHQARYYHDLPYDYLVAHGAELSGGRDFYITMFRLGHPPANSFDHARTTDPSEGEASTAIHPVFEMYQPSRGAGPTSCAHVLEDFLGDWSGREYLEAAELYFADSLRGMAPRKRPLARPRHIVRDEHMRLVDAASEEIP
jgi:thioredoxin reductase